MRHVLAMGFVLICVGSGSADGIMLPKEHSIPPLALVNQRVRINLDSQVAVTTVEQSFRNSTHQVLEATYVFPVPRGASVTKFSMWVNGKEMKGELLDAPRARQIYNDIVRRTKDPGLLEYVENSLFRLRVFPIAPNSEQKVSLTYSSVLQRDNGTVEYVYPLKGDNGFRQTLEDFSIEATIKSPDPIQNVFSPTHAISVSRHGEREVTVKFDKNQAILDKDFQLFYSCNPKEVGFSALSFRPVSSEKGYVMLLISPRLEAKPDEANPRDMVFVLDTSGSMRGAKMDQAKRALKYCLKNVGSKDRFGLIHFASVVSKYRDNLQNSSSEQLAEATRWVDSLEADGGTNIQDALSAALEYRGSDPGRTFTVVFFTDGMPTVGETSIPAILKNFLGKNTANTRVFTFGVGDDVNATFLDQLAGETRAVSTYVRPAEDIEEKVSGLYGKISAPAMTDLKLTAGGNIHFEEMYPPKLPDLFHGNQLIVLARYTGNGPATISLEGRVGSDQKTLVNETSFPEKTGDDKAFVEQIWARRKVGYLLDQIRQHGESRELVDETKRLAKRYGIATPYTSYLIVPDEPVQRFGRGGMGMQGRSFSGGIAGGGQISGGIGGISGGIGGGLGGLGALGIGGGGKPVQTGSTASLNLLRGPPAATITDFAKQAQPNKGDLAENRDKLNDAFFGQGIGPGAGLGMAGAMGGLGGRGAGKGNGAAGPGALPNMPMLQAAEKRANFIEAKKALGAHNLETVQGGKLGVELSIDSNSLRNQARLSLTALKNVGGRNCLEYAGIWIDEGFDAKTPTIAVKAQSDAYFRLLERQPKLKEVFQLGNALVWITPSGTALVIDPNEGKEKLPDAEIDTLFRQKK
jgi:Ca-activated chloride channel family protein